MIRITQIKEQFQQANLNEYEHLFAIYETDPRESVKKIIAQAKRKKEQYEAELVRTYQMQAYERMYAEYPVVVGIDEVGRGPLAGPVVAAAVVLPKNCDILYLNDSKQLSATKREELFDEIVEKAITFGIGMASHTQIDEINILNATYEAMRQAIQNLSLVPDVLLNDAVTIPKVQELFPEKTTAIQQVPIIKGDAKSASIAAASILAKVTRDRMMEQISEMYPPYDFASNKGYGSAKHIQALKTYGPCPIHRKSFIKNFV